MKASALAAIVGGLGLALRGGGGTILVVFAWLVGIAELSVAYWVLPIFAVVGVTIVVYGIAVLAGDILGDADGKREAVQKLDWYRLRHLVD